MDGGTKPERGAGTPPGWSYSARLPDALGAPQGWGYAVPGIPVPPGTPSAPVRRDGKRRDGGKPARDEPDDGKPNNDKPDHDKPGDEAGDEEAGDGKTAEDKPGNDKPGDKKAGDKDDKAKDAAKKPPMPRGKRLLYWFVGLLVLATLVTAGVLYWLNSRHYETTDDAYIDGNISQVSAQVGGRVVRIAFADNQEVRAGQVLVELDPRDFQVRLDQARSQRTQAQAQAAQTRAQLALQQANLDQAQANVRVTEADLGQAQADLARYRAIDPKAITRQQLDNQGAATKSAGAKLDANRQAVAGARAQIEAQRAMVAAQDAAVQQAEVTVRNAELQLSYATILAPADGQVTKRTVEMGNYVNPGQSLLAVVQDAMWVTVNFKETQLAAMQPGQYVRIRVDACPDLDLDARIGSFQGGSGQIFSSLPAENATGNFVKVVQRVPVRVNFDDSARAREKCRMAPGMSVSPRVTVR